MPPLPLRAALAATSAALALAAPPARADDPPKAREAGTFETYAATPANANNETRVRLQAGASLATGNTRSFAGNIAARFVLRRRVHQFTFDGAMNYGRAAPLPDEDMAGAPRQDSTTAENYLGRARYDYFVTNNNGIFLTGQAFRDVPSGFNSRLSGQLGYLRNFINEPERRRFWGELGYDLTYENLVQPPTGSTSNQRVINFARAFLGVEEKATPMLQLTAGLEGLLNLEHPGDYRLNGSLGMASKIADDFSLAVTFTLRYLHEPIGAREPLDTVTLVSVIFQRSLEPAPVPAPTAAAAGGAR